MRFYLRCWLPLLIVLTAVLTFRASQAAAPPQRMTQPPAAALQPVTPDPIETAQSADLPKDPAWQTWAVLQREVQAKVDPRLLTELSGQTLPAH